MASQVEERRALLDAYSGDRWADKVKKMTDGQVHAVYIRLKLQGRIK